MQMTVGWNHSIHHAVNARAIHLIFDHVPIRTHQFYGTTQFLVYRYFVLKKLEFSELEFESYMASSEVFHWAYASEIDRLSKLSRAWKAIRGVLG